MQTGELLTLRVRSALDVPKGVRLHSIFIASHLLLLVAPLGKFHFVREEIASLQGVLKPEVRAESPKTLPALHIFARALFYFYNPVIVRVAVEIWGAIRGHLVLEVYLGNGRADIMRMETLVRGEVVKTDCHLRLDVAHGRCSPVEVWVVRERSPVLNAPHVITITMGIESNLLL